MPREQPLAMAAKASWRAVAAAFARLVDMTISWVIGGRQLGRTACQVELGQVNLG